jgi:hypothetical protein
MLLSQPGLYLKLLRLNMHFYAGWVDVPNMALAATDILTGPIWQTTMQIERKNQMASGHPISLSILFHTHMALAILAHS